MFGGISAPFIHRPVATTLLMVAILLVGLVAFPSLPVAPLPQVDFPTITVAASLPGASPETMATSVAQPLERQIAQIPGVSQMTSTSALGVDRDHRPVRSQPQHRRRRQRHPGGDQRRLRPIAEGSAESADLSQGQPVRHADPHPVGPVRRRADHRRRRRGREHSRPAHQPDLRRLSGARRRPADAGHPHPDRSGEARREGPAARRRAGADRHRHRRQPQGRDHRAETDLHDLRQRSADRPPSPGTTSSSPIATARRCACATSARRSRDRTDTTQAAWSNGKRSVFLVVFKISPARTSSTPSRRSRSTLDDLAGGDPADHPRQRSLRSHDHHSRVGARRRVHAAAHHRAGRDGDLRFPAQPLGDDHSERDGAAVAARRLRADVGGRLQPRQSVADGLHDRGRLRRRRRDRDAREHHPPYRGGRKAVSGGAQRLGRDRLHHHLDFGVAGRGADPAPDDERHHRPAVPRILGHDRHDDLRVGGRFADAHPDDGLTFSQEPRRGASRTAL